MRVWSEEASRVPWGGVLAGGGGAGCFRFLFACNFATVAASLSVGAMEMYGVNYK